MTKKKKIPKLISLFGDEIELTQFQKELNALINTEGSKVGQLTQAERAAYRREGYLIFIGQDEECIVVKKKR